MKLLRCVVAAGLALGAVSLAGCAGNPDLAPLESRLAEVDGVNGAIAWPTHSGAPWNTQVNVLLFVDDPSEDALIDVVRAAAPALAADAAAGRNEVSVSFVEGDREDYADRFEAQGDELRFSDAVPEALGAGDLSGQVLTLSPESVRALAESR
jgi:hypothetical protein